MHAARMWASTSHTRGVHTSRTSASRCASSVSRSVSDLVRAGLVLTGGASRMEGVVELVQADMLPIALVVFVASILVPTFKLIGIALLLYSVQRHQPMSARQRILMYRFIEWIGRWSMLDIFVIAILVAVVNFGSLASIEAGAGAAAFASVVILTMLAALTFDPRLIWDNTETDHD